MTTKLEHTISKLEEWFERFNNPVVMSSFGKDSMAMLFIIFRLMKRKVPVIYHANPWKPWKNDWAWEMIKRWKLEVYDFPPIASGIKVKPDRLEIVHCYPVGQKWTQAPINILPPEDDFMCGLAMLARPKGTLVYPWNLTLIGHKSSDVDEFEGHMPLKADLVEQDGMPALGFPLKDWDDEDLWHFIETRNVPVQYRTRYDYNGKEIGIKTFNNDWIEACTRCIDPREPETVFCPLLEKEIPNVSESVTKFEGRPVYIGGEV